MSQSKVKDFFTLKKGIRDAQPSKRRKLLDPASDSGEAISKRAMMEEPVSVKLEKDTAEKPSVTTLKLNSSKLKSTESKATPKASSLSKIGSSTRSRTKPVSKSTGQKQKSLSDFVVIKDKTGLANVVSEVEKNQSKTEEATSFWDDHEDQLCTPRKRILTEMDSLSQGPKSRVKKSAVRKLNQVDVSSSSQCEVKKKLDLAVETEPMSKAESKKSEDESCQQNDASPSPKSSLLNLVGEMSGIQDAISPLALTPEHSDHASIPSTSTTNPVSMTPKLHDLSEKLKALSKMDGQALKNRLKKKGMLGDVKEKLQDLSKARAEVKAKPAVQETTQEKSEELPAYQRFDHLVKEGPPTLILPYAYRLLENAFQAMDTVVSMLHNRSEVCTFKKLQASVQNITKKNFPEKTVGQIKTVVPDAYTYKQEKVPVYGQRTSPYALVIEATLAQDEGEKKTMNKDGRIPFTASVLLKRKTMFKSGLLKIVKKHHKMFLESLNPPLHVPDAKLSRWHPKFALDKVPNVLPSSLPQRPDAVVLHSAKDVLEMQVGKLNPRIEKALSKVAAESSSSKGSNSGDQEVKTGDVPPSKENLSQTPTPSQSSMKGIPPALLAKIRAKEALKMEQALTRDPAEDKKIKMMSHLPEIIRILRSYFVTEKKPALPLDSVIKKLGDSYRTGMARGEVEEHIKLLKEVAPEFLSIVEVKKGKFVKLDKNVDITALSGRISNTVKSHK